MVIPDSKWDCQRDRDCHPMEGPPGNLPNIAFNEGSYSRGETLHPPANKKSLAKVAL